ncbi:AraC family transcriptional regulator [Pseudonocardia sp. H11422]|uniref:AraC family transcriptional regulator n=1 Tax=Pseudonocardia sp. H11422 TaxID=2835866 RepID=UPI001BDD0002|nr:AraC family transcriptional regulator [Pseudonocardia sp. H11422]
MSAEFFSYHEIGIDQAQAAVGESYYLITSMGLIDRRAPYEFHLDGVALGALSVGRAWYNAGIDVAMADLQTCYYVNFPQTGGMQADHRHRSVEIVPGRAAVYQPVGDVRMRTSGDYSSYAVRIDRAALENALAARLGRPTTGPLALGASLDLTRPAGANWARLVRLLANEALAHRSTRRTALTNPLIAAPLHDAVLAGLLQATDHPDREALEQSIRAWGVAPVHRAIDAMHAYLDQPFTPTGLAQIAGCSVRSLQEGFRRHVGLTPLQNLRQVRLEHAHHDLANGDPTYSTVTDIACHWGFTHLGRFATTYRARYGRSTSHALRRAPPTPSLRRPASAVTKKVHRFGDTLGGVPRLGCC